MHRREESDIYYTREKLERTTVHLEGIRNGERALEFLTHPQASGLSSIRVLRYAQCLPKTPEKYGRSSCEQERGRVIRSRARQFTIRSWDTDEPGRGRPKPAISKHL